MVVGGAIGNVADRLLRGYVVDFIHLHRWPVFNVADIAVTVGAILLGVAMTRRPPRALARLR
jgi:signal peptidase II